MNGKHPTENGYYWLNAFYGWQVVEVRGLKYYQCGFEEGLLIVNSDSSIWGPRCEPPK